MKRIVQCYSGGVGAEVARRLIAHPRMELAGMLVHSDDKAGRDIGEIVGAAPQGIAATQSLDAIIALRPDAAVWSAQGYTDDRDPAWAVELDASPPLVATLSWPEGESAAACNAHLNAARAVNVIEALIDAPPGCTSILELPMIACGDAHP